MNPQHSSECSEWYTPLYIIERARNVLGVIDLDPASDEFGNSRVRALRYIKKGDHDRVSADAWFSDVERGSVFLNPPGGRGLPWAFWRELLVARTRGTLTHAIYIGFSIEQMSSLQTVGGNPPSLCEFACCIPSRRISFDRGDGAAGPRPTHSNVIAYVDGRHNERDTFVREFGDLGKIMVPL